MRSRFKATALSTAMLVTLGVAASPSAFAASDASAAASPTDTLEEVVVTAQKREQNVQNVPLSVQVIGVDQLSAAAIENFEDFNRVAPSLLVRTDVTPINSTVAIRGIGTSAFGIGVEPSTAVVVDDVPQAFQARAFGNMSDISRVEILAGPQSTLYGKSATAGLINMVTPDPTSTFSGKFEATGTTDSERDFASWLSGPLTGTLAARLSVMYSDFPGTINNLYTHQMSDGAESVNAHGKLVWDPTSALKVMVNLNYSDGKTTNDYAFINLPANADLRGNPAYPPSAYLNGVVPGFPNTKIYNNYGTGTRYSNFDQSVKVSWDLGGPTLLSISSHSYYFLDDHQDYDYTAVAALDDRQQGYFHNTQWTEELRLVSPGTQPFRYTAGLFYADVQYARDFTRGPYFSLAGWDATEGSQQEAAFGQVEYDILDRLTLIAGARLGEERINYTYTNTLLSPPAVNSWAGNNSNSYVTYKVGPQYQLTDHIMLFALHATGHKGETYNLVTGFNTAIAESGPVRPETSSDYEVGAKMQFLDRHLTVNPTLFTTNYKDFQAQGIQVLPDGTTNFELENVGVVRTRGLEVNNSYRVSRDFTVGLSGTYLDASILEYPDAQCYPLQTAAEGCIGHGATAHQNLAGKNLFDAPKWKFTADMTYDKNLGFIPWVAVFQSSYTYTSMVNYALTQDPTTVQRSYGILNLSAGMHDADDRFKVTLFVNNVLDKHYHPDIANNASTFGSALAIGALVPRDFSTYAGIRVSAQF
jgi:iron complex outermembrane receptor protein